MDPSQKLDDEPSRTEELILSDTYDASSKAVVSLSEEEKTPYNIPDKKLLSNVTMNHSKHLILTKAFSDIDSVIDLPSYVKEHNNTLTFPEKVSANPIVLLFYFSISH